MKEGEESNAIGQNQLGRKGEMDNFSESKKSSDGSAEEPSLIQYRSKRRCVVEREKKKRKEWWEEENVLSDEEDFEDIDSDSSDNPRKRHKKKSVIPTGLLPPPNRIFMFSTELANRAAEAVIQGRVSSIVAYHRAQPQNQPYLRLQRNNLPEYMMNHSTAGNVNPYRYGNYAGHMSKMEGMYGKPVGMVEGQVPGRPGGMGGSFNSVQQYQQYLKQQQQQEPRSAMSSVDELQQMLFGRSNGNTKPLFTSSPAMSEQGVVRPPYGYPGPVAPGFRPQQMVMNNQREERFKFPQQQSFQNVTSPQQQAAAQQQQQQQPPPQQQQQQPPQQPQQQAQQQQQPTTQQQQQQQQPQPSPQASPFTTTQPGGQQSHLPVLSPSSSVSSSSPLGSNIRSPPAFPAPRGSEANTLPGGSTVIGAPSPTNVSSPHTPQTPHAPLTPRLSTSLASPKDGQRSPFSPGVPTSSTQFSTQVSSQQNIRDSGLKHPMARQSPNLDKPDLSSDKGIPGYPMMGESRVAFSTTTARQEVAQRPNSLDLSRDNHETQQLVPPNRSPFLANTSPMTIHPNTIGDSSTSHHPSKFTVESLTAPSEKERFYRAPFSVQGPSPYAAYSQQPGLFYAGSKFPPAMLGQGQYQFPAHIQSTPQQFFPPNIPPNMYLPRGSFPIHHAGNRDGGM